MYTSCCNHMLQSLSEWKTRRRTDPVYQPKVLSLVPDEIDVDKIVEAKKANQRKTDGDDESSRQRFGFLNVLFLSYIRVERLSYLALFCIENSQRRFDHPQTMQSILNCFA